MKLRLRMTRLFLVPGVLLALFSAPTHPEGSIANRTMELGGLVLLIVSSGGRVWAGAHALGRKNRTLVTDGPFSVVRNPLYLFSLIGFVGAGLAFGSLTLATVFALTFFAGHWPTIGAEERRLEELFPDAYEDYRAEVPRFVPSIRRPRSGDSLTLNPKGFQRSVLESMAIPMVYVLAEVVDWARVVGMLPTWLRIP